MRIMFLITRQFQILLNVRDMAGRGMDTQSIAKNAGIPPFAVKRNISQGLPDLHRFPLIFLPVPLRMKALQL